MSGIIVKRQLKLEGHCILCIKNDSWRIIVFICTRKKEKKKRRKGKRKKKGWETGLEKMIEGSLYLTVSEKTTEGWLYLTVAEK